MELDKNFFDDFEKSTIEHKGKKYELPAKYYDFSSIIAYFPVSARKLKKYLPTKKMKLVKPVPGISYIFIIAYQYKHISIMEPYNEVGIGFPLVFKDNKQKYEGSHFIHLPVTTEFARMAGVDLFGYPKFVADISYEEHENSITTTLKSDNEHILTLEVPKIEVEEERREVYSFTIKDNKILRIKITSQGYSGINQEKGKALLQLGEHPISGEIKSLLFTNDSVGHGYDPKRQMVLPLAEEEYEL